MCSSPPSQIVFDNLLAQILHWLEPPELSRLASVSLEFRLHVSAILYRSIALSAPPLPEHRVRQFGVANYHVSERRILRAPSFRRCQQLILPISRWSSRGMVDEGDCGACEERVSLPNLRSLVLVGGPSDALLWGTELPALHNCSLFDSEHSITVSFRGVDPRYVDSLPPKLRSADHRIRLTIPASLLDPMPIMSAPEGSWSDRAEAADSREGLRFERIDVAFVSQGELGEHRGKDSNLAMRVVEGFLSLATFLRRRSRARVAFAGTHAITLVSRAESDASDNPSYSLEHALEAYRSQTLDFELCDLREDEADFMPICSVSECGGW